MNEMTPESVSARDPPRFRLMMAVAFVAVVALACVVAAALLLWRAAEEHADLRQQSLSDAVALSNALDQEVAAMNYLLKGLSTSPALRAGDYKSFYDQLTATPVPEGSWLILHDLEGQVLNTLRPFGAALPRHSDYPTSPVDACARAGMVGLGPRDKPPETRRHPRGTRPQSGFRRAADEALPHHDRVRRAAPADHDRAEASRNHARRRVRS